VSTRRLFARLLRTFDVKTVCDVGSMDGADAQYFRRHLPGASILALEPNPANFELMQRDGRLSELGIRVLPFAASDRDSEAPFFVVDARHGVKKDRFRRGMSSLHRRADHERLGYPITVRTVRLDGLLQERRLAQDALALWIDAEGMAYEVIQGAEHVLANTRLLHVEVETTPCIGATQHLFPEVRRCLEQAGFELLATDHPVHQVQFNALFVRADVLRAHAATVRAWRAVTWLTRNSARLVLGCIPMRLRRRFGLWLY
jgi:FkbM family methyltransferase